MITILHISDIHAGSPEFDFYTYRLDQILYEIQMNIKVNFLVCSGDLSFKGQKNGYQKAIIFFKKATKFAESIILVPGNHDICPEERLFTSFDVAAEKINDQFHCSFSSRSCGLFCTEEIDFFLVNSAYKGEREYGEINIDELKHIVTSAPTGKKRILITHHPFLTYLNDKCSSVRNSGEVLQYLAKSSFTAILHGHQHMNTRFGFKFEKTIVDVIGIRSLSLPSPGVPIGAQLISIDNSGVKVKQIDLSKDKDMTC